MGVEPELDAIAMDSAIDCLQRQGAISLRVSGRNMTPVIREKDVVTIRETAVTTMGIGDLVALGAGHGVVVHRLPGIKETAEGILLLTKGDSQSRVDCPWSSAQYLGRLETLNGPRGRIDLTSRRWRWTNRI